MKMTKLLTGAAVAAIMSGTAFGQAALTEQTAAATLPLKDSTFIAAEFQPASAANQLAGNLVLRSAFGAASPFAAIPVDGRAELTIALTNAEFTTATGASFTGNDGGACAFETAPVAGGGVGNSSVTFVSTAGAGINTCTVAVDNDGGNPGGNIGDFTIPVRRSANGAPIVATFTYTQVNADRSTVASAVTEADSLTFAETAAAVGAQAGVVEGFTAGAELLATSAGILSAGNLGTVRFDFRDQANNSVPAAVNIEEDDGSQVVLGDIYTDNNKIDITFPNGIGDINGVAVAGAGACVITGNTASCPVTAAQLTGIAGAAANITYTVGGGATPPVTPEQTPSATLTLEAQANYTASTGFSGNLANIKHDNGLRTGNPADDEFEWVAIGDGGAESNFRLEFANATDAGAINKITVAVANGNGLSAQNIELSANADAALGFVVRGSTVTFNSRALGAGATFDGGATRGNADITAINIEYREDDFNGAGAAGDVAAVAAVQARRQLINRSPSNFVAVPGLAGDPN